MPLSLLIANRDRQSSETTHTGAATAEVDNKSTISQYSKSRFVQTSVPRCLLCLLIYNTWLKNNLFFSTHDNVGSPEQQYLKAAYDIEYIEEWLGHIRKVQVETREKIAVKMNERFDLVSVPRLILKLSACDVNCYIRWSVAFFSLSHVNVSSLRKTKLVAV